MMKNPFYYLSVLMMFCSCKKVISVNLNDSNPQYVITGSITNQSGPYQIKIVRSVNFNQASIYPAVTGALVTVLDDSIPILDTLSEILGGLYQTHSVQGKIGHTYHLKIQSNGNIFEAQSTMPELVTFDSITFQSNNGFAQTFVNAIPNFQDPPGKYNAYRFIESINNRLVKQIYVFDDRLSDGRYISRQLFADSTLNPNDSVTIEMHTLDKPIFEYFKELSGLDPTNGQPTSPANPISNVSNNALGYFSANTVQKKTKVYTK